MTRIRKSPSMTGSFAKLPGNSFSTKEAQVLNMQMNRNVYPGFAVSVKNRVSQK